MIDQRFTIERATAPAFRNERGKLPARFLGHDRDGKLVWDHSLKIADTYASKAEAESFRRQRLGSHARALVIGHSVH